MSAAGDAEKAYEQVVQSKDALVQYWHEHVYLTPRWWILWAIFALGWGLWAFFRKKESTDRLLYAGFFVVMITSWLDFLGVHFGLWYYKVDLIPTPPSFIAWDFCMFPVTVMFALQIKPNFNPFLKAVIYAFFTAFIAEPIFEWTGFYVRRHWQHYYSFPIEIVIFLVAYYISRRNKFAEIK